MSGVAEPSRADVVEAAARIAGTIRHTPVEASRQLDARSGASVFVKCEQLQRTGAFKGRGATNAVMRLDDDAAARGVACHSSGNHGGALAWAASVRGIPATIVVPWNAPAPKLAAIEGYGARVVPCEPTSEARESALAEVVASTGATEIHPYDHPHVIAGAGTAALELIGQVPELDAVVVPLGGGGLLSGSVLACDGTGTAVWGAEPLGADDAARSLAAGRRLDDDGAHTIADGLRTPLSDRTFGIIAGSGSNAAAAGILTVTDEEILDSMRFCWERMKVLGEASGVIGIATLLRGDFAGKRVGVIVSGGNVDLDALPW